MQIKALERELAECEKEQQEVEMRNDIVMQILSMRMNSKEMGKGLTEEEIEMQIK